MVTMPKKTPKHNGLNKPATFENEIFASSFAASPPNVNKPATVENEISASSFAAVERQYVDYLIELYYFSIGLITCIPAPKAHFSNN